MVNFSLPPGPPLPSYLQTLLFLKWPFSYVEYCRRRYGDVFTLRLTVPGEGLPGPVVYLAETAAIADVFRRDGREGHAGAANELLEPIVGPHAILLQDGNNHLAERRLISPGFHGKAVAGLEQIVREATDREMSRWPANEELLVRPAMQRITFEVITRAVLGVHDEALQKRLLKVLEPLFNITLGQLAGLAPAFRFDLGPWSPWGRFRRIRERADTVLFELIAQRRREEPRDDLLGVLLAATDEQGVPISDRHVRDELVTMLLAGHETTATALAWAFERLAHNPAVTSRLRSDIAAGDIAAIEAAAAETLRVRPVVMDVARRLSEDVEVAGHLLRAGTTVMPAIYLVQLDPKNYEDPETFCPERFRDEPPSRETWIPFGGGRRRCIGAALAQMEMRTVLEMVLRKYVPEPVSPRPERPRLRAVTFVPEDDARMKMRPEPLPRVEGIGCLTGPGSA